MNRYQRIVSDIAEQHGVTVKQIRGRKRGRVVTAARYEAIIRLLETGTLSDSDIGELLHKDRTSIFHYRAGRFKTRHIVKEITP